MKPKKIPIELWVTDDVRSVQKQFLEKVNKELERRITQIQAKEKDPQTPEYIRKINAKDLQFFELLINFHQVSSLLIEKLTSDFENINQIASNMFKENEFWIELFSKGLKEFKFDPSDVKPTDEEMNG